MERHVVIAAIGTLVALLVWWTCWRLLAKNPWIFLDGVNLLLHEGSHAVMRWAPMPLYIFAGSAGQVLWPLTFAGYFTWIRPDAIAKWAMIWWAGESSLGVAHYMADAIDMALPTVGGEIHDWNFLMQRYHLLPHTLKFAAMLRACGSIVMLVALAAIIRLSVQRWRLSAEVSE